MLLVPSLFPSSTPVDPQDLAPAHEIPYSGGASYAWLFLKDNILDISTPILGKRPLQSALEEFSSGDSLSGCVHAVADDPRFSLGDSHFVPSVLPPYEKRVKPRHTEAV